MQIKFKKSLDILLAIVFIFILIIIIPKQANAATSETINIVGVGDFTEVQTAIQVADITNPATVLELTVTGAQLDFTGCREIRNKFPNLQKLILSDQLILPDRGTRNRVGCFYAILFS